MPLEFNTFWTLNLTSGQLNSVATDFGVTHTPVIFSTPNQNYAMGAYLARAPLENVRYLRQNFTANDSNKWSILWNVNAVMPPGTTHSFESLICVGTLQQVQTCMLSLSKLTGYVDGYVY